MQLYLVMILEKSASCIGAEKLPENLTEYNFSLGRGSKMKLNDNK